MNITDVATRMLEVSVCSVCDDGVHYTLYAYELAGAPHLAVGKIAACDALCAATQLQLWQHAAIAARPTPDLTPLLQEQIDAFRATLKQP